MPLQYTPRSSRLVPKFPNDIRSYRLKAGLSQRALAKLLGHGRNAVSAWERGIVLPKLSSALKMAKILGTLAEALYRSFYSPEREGAGQEKPRA